jgi:hypothetical protein
VSTPAIQLLGGKLEHGGLPGNSMVESDLVTNLQLGRVEASAPEDFSPSMGLVRCL